jgi:dihydrofolate reductase
VPTFSERSRPARIHRRIVSALRPVRRAASGPVINTVACYNIFPNVTPMRTDVWQRHQDMPKLRVHNIAMSLDGYMAGPDQSLDNPLGVGGRALHEWVFATRFGQEMIGGDGGDTGLDDEILRRGDENIGAHILGRNMFGPVRGDWPDDSWKGWWGDEPPYHHAVFVLTNHARDPIPMQGGTTFHFVTDGIESALQQAFAAADGADVRIGGGASTIRQYLRAGLVDELPAAISPILLGGGESLFGDLGPVVDGYEVVEMISSPAVTHVRLARKTA